MRDIKIQNCNVLYALHYKGKLLGTFKWEGGNTSVLYGWRPPKKIYFKIGQANCGVSHLPQEIIDDIEIVMYGPISIVKKCSLKEKENNKKKRELRQLKRNLNYWERKAIKERMDLRETREKIKQLEKELQ